MWGLQYKGITALVRTLWRLCEKSGEGFYNSTKQVFFLAHDCRIYDHVQGKNLLRKIKKWWNNYDHLLNKHCQRHNGPEGRVLLTKVTSLGHITSSQKKSWSYFIFIISTEQQLRNLNQISAFGLHLNFKILTKRSFRIPTKNNLYITSTKDQQQNTD